MPIALIEAGQTLIMLAVLLNGGGLFGLRSARIRRSKASEARHLFKEIGIGNRIPLLNSDRGRSSSRHGKIYRPHSTYRHCASNRGVVLLLP